MTSVNHTHQLVTSNGVFITEFDCVVELTVARSWGVPDAEYIKSIDAILVSNGRGIDLKVVDLLDPDSGLLWLGNQIRERLMNDKEFQRRAVEEYLSEQSQLQIAAE